MDVPGDILQENHYYPFGMNMNYGWLNAAALDNRYQYNGKELNDDFGLNWSDYGARWYEASVGRFHSIDRFSEKFRSQQPYTFAADNPLKYIDINGDSIWIATKKDGNLLYESGKLVKQDGVEYKGKIKGSLKKTLDAIQEINKSEYGKNLIHTLAKSNHNFTIKYTEKGVSRFASDIGNNLKAVVSNNAFALQVIDQKARLLSFVPFSDIGSGGDIIWNPDQGGVIGLGHEIGHAFDANFGMLDSREVELNGGHETTMEINAVYHENMIRYDLGIGLRERYMDGPLLLNEKNNPYTILHHL